MKQKIGQEHQKIGKLLVEKLDIKQEELEKNNSLDPKAKNLALRKINVRRGLAYGAATSQLEIGHEAYRLFLKEYKPHRIQEAGDFCINFLVLHGLFDIYQQVIFPDSDAITKEIHSLNPNNFQNHSSYWNAVARFGDYANDIMNKRHASSRHQDNIPFYLYLNKIFLSSNPESNVYFLINNVCKIIVTTSNWNEDDTNEDLYEKLTSDKGAIFKLSYFINYLVNHDNFDRTVHNKISNYHKRLLTHCGFDQMKTFLAGNRGQRFFLNEVASNIQLQMIKASLQEEMQPEPEKKSFFSLS